LVLNRKNAGFQHWSDVRLGFSYLAFVAEVAAVKLMMVTEVTMATLRRTQQRQ